MTSSPTPAVLSDARACVCGKSFGSMTDDGHAINCPASYQYDAGKVWLNERAVPPASDAPASGADERTDADLLRLIAKDHQRLAPNAYHTAETLRQIADRIAAAPKVASAPKEHAWTGDGNRAADGYDGPICTRCGLPDLPSTPEECRA